MTNNVIIQLETAIRNALSRGAPVAGRPSGPKVQPKPREHEHAHDHDKALNVTSPFGTRTLRGKESFHRGIDIGLPVGSPIYAVDSGVVQHAGWQDANDHKKGGGIFIKISHGDSKDSFYMHLSSLNVAKGDEVKAGQLIGSSGDTGDSTGPHLHLELRQGGTPRAPTSQEVSIAQHGLRSS